MDQDQVLVEAEAEAEAESESESESPSPTPTPLLSITVSDPMIVTRRGKKFAVYTIHTQSEDPCFSIPDTITSRRFSEFHKLRKLLASRHRDLKIPALPSKCVMPCCRLKRKTMDRRVRGLQKFINRLIGVRDLKEDDCLFHFLQTNRSMANIKRYVAGVVDNSSCSERLMLMPRMLTDFRKRLKLCPLPLFGMPDRFCPGNNFLTKYFMF